MRSGEELLELLHEWDPDRSESGEVDKVEFRKAVQHLGFDLALSELHIDSAFDSLNRDSSFSQRMRELEVAREERREIIV